MPVPPASPAFDAPVGVTPTQLRNVAIAAVVAGVAMGLVLQALTRTIPVIGALYGANSVTVGWIIHLFHSLVFGVLFAAVRCRPPVSTSIDSLRETALLAVGYGAALWLVAAGIVMPVWLTLVGVPTPVPRLSPAGLLGHVVWGATFGSLFDLLPGTG